LWFFYREFFRSHPSPARILHFAPETCFRPLFTSHAQHYITSNFDHETSGVRLDLNHLGLMEESIDVIIATGVLTATDGAIAIDEIHRVLRSGGFALICDIVIPSGHSQDLPDRPMGLRYAFGELDLARHFQCFDVDLLDIVGFVPESDRERLGVRADNFNMIQVRKLERRQD
jgi:SAM-dependent methyltransferase